jgi:2,4-dienoyl-CoA reductase-like NADH-dependent reductase (Old Yellow Enzyme family)
MDVSPLFKPLTIRGLTVSNRFAMAPMTRHFSPNGVPGPDVAGYYRRRAMGETGLIITEGTGIDHPASLADTDVPRMYGKAALAGWRHVVDEVHSVGGKIAPQLWHQGVIREHGTGPVLEAEPSRPSGLWGPLGQRTTCAPAYIERVQEMTRPMTESEIGDVLSGYVRSARHAVECGFDCIAIHGAHGYLPDAFLWNETNQRTDRWGGSIKHRSNFAVELVKRVRSEIGEKLPIIFRFSQWKQQDFYARLANTPAELEQIIGPISDAGVDVFDASVRNFNDPAFESSDLGLAGWAKKITGRITVTVGGVGLANGRYDSRREGGAPTARLDALVDRFARGEFDLVAVGRSLLQDPEWVLKARAGEPFRPYSEQSVKVLT